jgi:predicted nucleic acid-binding protein
LAEVIDEGRLPETVLLDTTVLIPAADGPARTDQDRACKPLLEALVSAKKTILVAAPSLAEFLRKSPRRPLPHATAIEVLAFDQRAAQLLSTKFPMQVLVSYRDAAKQYPPIDYIKYDAMIVACALRHKAGHFISLDNQQLRMAAAVGLHAARPRDFMSKQQSLQYPEAGPSKTSRLPLSHPPK